MSETGSGTAHRAAPAALLRSPTGRLRVRRFQKILRATGEVATVLWRTGTGRLEWRSLAFDWTYSLCQERRPGTLPRPSELSTSFPGSIT